MYLPLSSTFLYFLQLPLSPSDPVAFDGQSEAPHKDYENLAILSPYHDAPNVPGVSVNLPDDCTVDQVIMVSSLPHSVPVLRVTSSSYTDMDPVVPSPRINLLSDSLKPWTACGM